MPLAQLLPPKTTGTRTQRPFREPKGNNPTVTSTAPPPWASGPMPDPTSWPPSEARTGVFETHGTNQNILVVSPVFSRGKGVIGHKQFTTVVLYPDTDFPSFCTSLAPVDISGGDPWLSYGTFGAVLVPFNLLSCCGVIPKYCSTALVFAHNVPMALAASLGCKTTPDLCEWVWGKAGPSLWCATPQPPPGVPTRSTVVRNKPARQ